MGRCLHCGTMIYNHMIAETGYHRECRERMLLRIVKKTSWTPRELRKMDRRRVRRKELRDIKKGKAA